MCKCKLALVTLIKAVQYAQKFGLIEDFFCLCEWFCFQLTACVRHATNAV